MRILVCGRVYFLLGVLVVSKNWFMDVVMFIVMVVILLEIYCIVL